MDYCINIEYNLEAILEIISFEDYKLSNQGLFYFPEMCFVWAA